MAKSKLSFSVESIMADRYAAGSIGSPESSRSEDSDSPASKFSYKVHWWQVFMKMFSNKPTAEPDDVWLEPVLATDAPDAAFGEPSKTQLAKATNLPKVTVDFGWRFHSQNRADGSGWGELNLPILWSLLVK